MTDTDAGRLPVSRESRTTGPISSAAIRTPAARPLSAATFAWSLVRHNPRWASVRGRVHLATLVAWAGFVAITAPVAMLVLQTGDPFGPDVLIGWQNRLMVGDYLAWIATTAAAAIGVRKDG